MPHRVGYCCINTQLNKQKVLTGRTMRQATFEERGIKHASTLALQNAQDLVKILKWNHEHHITLFRIGSGIFPWATEYRVEDLPDYVRIVSALQEAGNFIKDHHHRVSMHPDHFVKLGSVHQHVRENSIKELEIHAQVFDLMGLAQDYTCPINIHVGMNFSYEVVEQWLRSYDELSHSVKSRLVVENDDKATGFSVQQLYDTIHKKIYIPITFDYFHHEFHPQDFTTREAAILATYTWKHYTPLFHYSESKALNEHLDVNPRAHSDFVFKQIDDFGLHLDIDLEAKMKEHAVFQYGKYSIN